MSQQPMYRLHAFIGRSGSLRAQTNAYIAGGTKPIGWDIFDRSLCLPSDNKMTAEQQDRIIEVALDFKKRLHETIEILILQGYKHMISGGAQGMDLMAAETVLDLQKDYPEVTLEIAVPFETQAVKWSEDYRKRWQHYAL